MGSQVDTVARILNVITTRQLASNVLAEHALTLMRAGVSLFVMTDMKGGKALATAETVSAANTTYVIRFNHLRPLAASDVEHLTRVGVGSFVPPRPPAQPHDHVQD